ncbi:Clp protease N-terminal domain-containing protein [Promicromonospora sp. NFX87]|uniref:Clp protease N-terminal domain-containing protein n=1 Tax=Promicromonospora sp. NFX87 TaxID=3402691 RepID=UPI003AFA04F7
MTVPRVTEDMGWDGEVESLVSRLDSDANAALYAARHESRTLGHDQTSTVHLVLAILSEPGGVSYRALTAGGMVYEDCRAFVASLAGSGDRAGPADGRQAGWLAEDAIAALHAASAGNGDDVSLADLLLEAVREPGPVAKPLLQSYAITTQLLETFFARAAAERIRADSWANEVPAAGLEFASPLAHDLVRSAMAEGLTIDGLIWSLLTSTDGDKSRAGLALSSLDAPCVEIANLLRLTEPALVADDPTQAHVNLAAVAAGAPRWLPRTGDRRVDSVHLFLAAMEHSPQADFATALKTLGITDDFLVAAAVDVRRDTGPRDRSGVPDALMADGPRGPAPTLPPAESAPAPGVRNPRWNRRLHRASMPSNSHLNTDLQIHRLWRYSLVTPICLVACVIYDVLLIIEAIRTGNWWLLGAIPLGTLAPAWVPVPVWLGAPLVVVWFIPPVAQLMLALILVSTALSTWIGLQWRRAATGDPTYGLARWRRDTWISSRSFMMGGSQ